MTQQDPRAPIRPTATVDTLLTNRLRVVWSPPWFPYRGAPSWWVGSLL